MDITYLGHSSFKIKTKNAVVVTDPFNPKLVGLKFPSIDADLVTISHNHEDHNYLQGVKGYKKVFDGPGEYDSMDVSFRGVSSFHDDKKGEIRGKNTMFVIEAEGITLAHLGDLGHIPNEKELEELESVNILFIPIGGTFTINSNQAIEIIKKIEPQITIPMHFKSSGINEEEFGKLGDLDDFLENIGLTVEKADKLSIKDIDLGETQKVVVLEKK